MQNFNNGLDLYRPTQIQHNPQSWIDYTIDNNGVAVLNLVESYGYPSSDTRETLKRIVFAFINEYGDEAYLKLKQLHPDYRLFFPYRNSAAEPKIIEQKAPIIIEQPAEQPKQQLTTTNINETDKEFFKKAIIVGLIIVGVVQLLKVMPNGN